MTEIQIPTIEVVDINLPHEDGKNPNLMPKQILLALEKNLKKYGFLVPIITNKDYLVADGAHRLQAAKNVGMAQVPIIRLDVDEVDRRMLRQIMNKLRGEHDQDKDILELQFLQDNAAFERLRDLLPSIAEVQHLLQKEVVDPDAFGFERAAKEPKYKVNLGDTFKLGMHTLMCGDATHETDVLNLMTLGGGQLADAVFTDPPYGVDYESVSKLWDKIANDEFAGESLKGFLLKSFKNIHSITKANPAVYVCYASRNHTIFEQALNSAGFEVKQQLIWDKGSFTLGRSDYHWSHEPILYCIKTKRNCAWYGDRAEKTVYSNPQQYISSYSKEELVALFKEMTEHTTVLKINRDSTKDNIHPTQKPVGLAEQCIRNNTNSMDVVFDPFAGSGSTLIACEKSRRKCLTLELDKNYVSAIIERWELYTGEKAEKIE